ncbi:MAG: GH3 auxin-responsive promoter family protein [Prevotellaceae bacterium]|jgi:hypothetical protein|nr:GH3 auxin-responsive promoter family protein [Prevotellaceae bacterium]
MSTLCHIYSLVSKPLLAEVEATRKDPFPFQLKTFDHLMSHGAKTLFGKERSFKSIQNYREFQKQVKLHQYEDLLPYIELIRRGEHNVLWDQKVSWFAMSSGTSGTKSKFIPMPDHILRKGHNKGMRTVLAVYLDNYPHSRLLNGKSITLGGSYKIDEMGDGKRHYGDLSSLLLSLAPFWAEWFRTPPKSMVLQDDFTKKVQYIAKHIINQDVTSFSGVPSWNLLLMRQVLECSGKSNLLEIWPHLELFIHGGISFDPYREQYSRLIPSPDMHYLETYNASEGFFALQDDPNDLGLLLLPNCGVFYEFIPLQRLQATLDGDDVVFETLESVQKGVDYAMVISTVGGLWRYLIGDTVRFTSLLPHKLVITGRTKLFINAFGEELMIEHAEKALVESCKKHQAIVSDFTVAPIFMGHQTKGAHEWLIEFEVPPVDLEVFAADLDAAVCRQNSDYEAKRINNVTMLPLLMHSLQKGCFHQWLKQKKRLGGQNKVPRLQTSRYIIEEIHAINKMLTETHVH